ncbi:MAG: Binding-protein-dependent transport systems inner membrane component [Acetothermia bacterium 64_32]|nr:MAG: Binding-protein-dependent transport systems inner membrane component [Acetothermia bacterium 64_32]HAF71418.1 peptide ABC transporter permease [Candidatus Acetothermia bacterium]
MFSYIARRLLLALVVVFGVLVVTFLLTRVVPSDPAARWVGPHATADQIAAARAELGLDKPLYVQFYRYLAGLVKGDWGISIRTHRPVLQDLGTYLPATLELILFGLFLAVVVGLPLGVLSAAHNNTPIDHLSRLVSIAGVALPTFWLGMILQLVFFKQLRWFPLSDRLDMMVELLSPVKKITGFYIFDSLITGNLPALKSALWHIFLPGLTIAAYPLGLAVRMTRATMLEVLSEDYIRTARAYGVPETNVHGVHALRNALGPVLTVLALTFAYSLVEAFLVESIFTWPGLGYYASNAIMTVDYPAIMGVTLLISLTYVFLNLLVDVSLAFLDPRIRLG